STAAARGRERSCFISLERRRRRPEAASTFFNRPVDKECGARLLCSHNSQFLQSPSSVTASRFFGELFPGVPVYSDSGRHMDTIHSMFSPVFPPPGLDYSPADGRKWNIGRVWTK